MKYTKWIAVVLATLCLLSLCACSVVVDTSEDENQKDSQKDKAPAEVDLGALKAEILSDLGVTDSVDVATDMLLDLYGIDAADVADSACYMTMDGVFPDEVIMIKAKDADAAGRVAQKLNARLDAVKIQSESYDPDNYALAQKCSVQTSGVYVTLFLSPNYARMTELFNEAAK